MFVRYSKGLVQKHISPFRRLNSQTPINDHSAQLELKGCYGVFFLKFALCVIFYLFCVMMRDSQFREYGGKICSSSVAYLYHKPIERTGHYRSVI